MTDTTEAAEVVRDLATAATRPHKLEVGGYYALLTQAGVQKIDLTGDQYADYPRRKAGKVTVRNVASFAQYYGKHADEGSEVFADLDAGTVTAVLDAHHAADEGEPETTARWQQHRLILALQPTLPWAEWIARDRKFMSQELFAEFLEEHARDIDPQGSVKSADLLETAQHFKATIKASVTSGKRVSSGQTEFSYVEEITASGQNAQRHTMEMPNEFDLLTAPYEDIAPAVMAVRLRYRIQSDKSLSLLADECGVTVMHGQPA